MGGRHEKLQEVPAAGAGAPWALGLRERACGARRRVRLRCAALRCGKEVRGRAGLPHPWPAERGGRQGAAGPGRGGVKARRARLACAGLGRAGEAHGARGAGRAGGRAGAWSGARRREGRDAPLRGARLPGPAGRGDARGGRAAALPAGRPRLDGGEQDAAGGPRWVRGPGSGVRGGGRWAFVSAQALGCGGSPNPAARPAASPGRAASSSPFCYGGRPLGCPWGGRAGTLHLSPCSSLGKFRGLLPLPHYSLIRPWFPGLHGGAAGGLPPPPPHNPGYHPLGGPDHFKKKRKSCPGLCVAASFCLLSPLAIANPHRSPRAGVVALEKAPHLITTTTLAWLLYFILAPEFLWGATLKPFAARVGGWWGSKSKSGLLGCWPLFSEGGASWAAAQPGTGRQGSLSREGPPWGVFQRISPPPDVMPPAFFPGKRGALDSALQTASFFLESCLTSLCSPPLSFYQISPYTSNPCLWMLYP